MTEQIDADKLAAILQAEYRVADGYHDQLTQLERLAFEYYEAAPFGNEVTGRSQMILPDVQESIDYMTQSVLRTFVSGDRAVEFEALEEEDEDAAKEATEAVNYIFMRRQDGYRLLHDGILDGLLRKRGIFKTVKETVRKVSRQRLTIDPVQLGEMPEDVEIDDLTENEDGSVTVSLKQVKTEQRFVDYCIPTSEFRFTPSARHEDDANYLCHTCEKTRSDLVEMGFDPEQVYRLPGSNTLPSNQVESGTLDQYIADESSPALQKVMLCEEYARVDMDGDGIAERVKIYRVENEILIDAETGELAIEAVDEQPFAVFCPYPRSHRLIGYSLADKVMDIQLARSFAIRQLFDGMAFTAIPRPVVDSRMADADTYSDILNPIPGSPIRVPGGSSSVQPYQSGFDVGKSLQVLEMLTGERESRTGITRLNQGLDADALNKMLCIETPVPMADGSYKRLADVADGDWLIGGDGEPVYTIKAHKIHDPERAYRIGFASGEQIDAGGEHLWTVQTDNDKRYNKTQTVDTDRLFEMMQGKGRVYIPRVARPQAGTERELPLDPYLLGVWLGDGSAHAPRITTMDAETAEYAGAWAAAAGATLTVDKQQNSGAATSYYVGGLYTPLREMKLLKRGDAVRDADIIGKHIPEEYFRASYRQRMELLRGLMDTDGCLHSNSLAVFCQREGRLLDDTVRLIESVGGWPKLTKLNPKGRFPHRRNHYQVFFDTIDCPFKLARKATRWKRTNRNATTQVVKSIERIAVKPMRCLTVAAADGLFCVGKRFTVTHNTATGTALMQAQGQQQEEYIARNFAETLGRLFAKKYRLMRAEGEPFSVKVDGQYKQVDPSVWPEDMNLTIRVGLGSGSKDKRIQYRMMLLQPMAEGLAQGLVSPKNAFNLIDGLARDMGIGDGDEYWIDPDSPEAQNAPKEDKPDPEMLKLQAEQQKAQAQLQLEAGKAQAQLELERGKAEAAIETDRMKTQAQLDAMREKHALEMAQARERMDQEAQLAREKMILEAQLEREAMQMRAETDVTLGTNREGGALDA